MNVKITKAQKIRLLNSGDIYTIMLQVLLRENKIDRNKEHFWTIGLDNSNRILYVELISLGTTTSAPIEPMQVFRVAILKGAIQMVLVHNHPSSQMKPSQQDIDITDRLIQVGEIVGIKILDHLIISEQTYNSFSDTDLLEKIRKSSIYVPDYKQLAQIKREVAETTLQKEKRRIAKQLREKGFTVDQVVELTGISKEEAEKIRVPKR